ncbi:hypothetical protein E4U14_007498 [Claviceps sp. LM454 group G7]|nr:hypothetical protein E4U14_007498 [Claviceps sp. LM454 group G7]
MRDTVQDKASWAEHGFHVEPRFPTAVAGVRVCCPPPGPPFPHRIRKHDDEHDGPRRSCYPMLAGRIGYSQTSI